MEFAPTEKSGGIEVLEWILLFCALSGRKYHMIHGTKWYRHIGLWWSMKSRMSSKEFSCLLCASPPCPSHSDSPEKRGGKLPLKQVSRTREFFVRSSDLCCLLNLLIARFIISFPDSSPLFPLVFPRKKRRHTRYTALIKGFWFFYTDNGFVIVP